MSVKPRAQIVTIIAWMLLLVGLVAVVAAVVMALPRDLERRMWYTLFALAIAGALAIRSGVSLLRTPRVPRTSVSTLPAP